MTTEFLSTQAVNSFGGWLLLPFFIARSELKDQNELWKRCESGDKRQETRAWRNSFEFRGIKANYYSWVVRIASLARTTPLYFQLPRSASLQPTLMHPIPDLKHVWVVSFTAFPAYQTYHHNKVLLQWNFNPSSTRSFIFKLIEWRAKQTVKLQVGPSTCNLNETNVKI